jgi:hypothetical protein
MWDILHPCGDKLVAESDVAQYNSPTCEIEKWATRAEQYGQSARRGDPRAYTGIGTHPQSSRRQCYSSLSASVRVHLKIPSVVMSAILPNLHRAAHQGLEDYPEVWFGKC